MKCKVVIAGGTGFIGRALERKFKEQGTEVLIISRDKKHINWSDLPAITAALEGAEMLINLAGRSVDCRYTEKNKKEILDSRVDTTRILGEAILRTNNPPPLWINAGTATIYRHAEDRPMTEEAGDIGSGFSVNVAKAWEQAFFGFKLPKTRQVALRMAIVLGKGGGVLKPLQTLAKLGMGGKQGNGEQMFSWIHIDDLWGIINFIHENEDLEGVFNASAPRPVKNKVLMSLMRKYTGTRFGLPMSVWLLKMGAMLINTETELILKSRWVLPERLINAGFQFSFPDPDSALKQILNKKPAADK